MLPEKKNKYKKSINTPASAVSSALISNVHQLAFDHAVLAHIISKADNGKILNANITAGILLGYSVKSLLTKSISVIFDMNERAIKKMLLQQGTDEGKHITKGKAISKNGELIPCEINAAVFMDVDGIEKVITTITDMRKSILFQKNIDIKNEKIVADNIGIAKLKQKDIDVKNKKIVSDNIDIARSKQKSIDVKNKKIVSDNIDIARSKQKSIDVKNKKIVADNIEIALARSEARLALSNTWIKYIAKSCYDVMWDWDFTTDLIYVGDSVAEVFGYKAPEDTLPFKDFSHCFLADEKKAVEKKLVKSLVSGSKSWNDSFKILRYDGSVANTSSRASIIRNSSGKAIRMIGAIQDISRLNELEKKLVAQRIFKKQKQNNKLSLTARLTYDGIWDWNLLTNDFFLGEGFEELFGYAVKNMPGNMTDWTNYLHPGDKEPVKKRLQDALDSAATNWEDTYRFIKADDSITQVLGRGSIIRLPDGKPTRMIGVMHDLSRQNVLHDEIDRDNTAKEKLLTAYQDSFKHIFNSSTDVFYDCDLLTGVVSISDAYEKEFGYKISGNMTPVNDWLSHLHPGDQEAVFKDYQRMLASKESEWKYNYRFLRADNTEANVISNGIILRDSGGKAYRMIGTMHDSSKQRVLEEKFEHKIRLKEKLIAEAAEDAKNTERSDIGKELHDNINQLLSASRMFLEMAKRGGENSKIYLNRSSEYTLKAIEEIRKLTRGLTTDIIKNLGLIDAIEQISRETMDANNIKITCILDSFKENTVHNKFKLNVYRIVQEQLNNILKHAEATEASICLLQDEKTILLMISDNGVGFDTGQKKKGIGIDNIKSRAEDYHGSAEFKSKPGDGCVLTVVFPVSEILLSMNSKNSLKIA